MVSYVKRMRDLREDNDLTQAQVAQLLHMKQQQYQAYESGTVKLPIDRLEELSKLYNVSTDYILGLTDNPKRI